MSPSMQPAQSGSSRRASIEVAQLPNGYWSGTVVVMVPGVPDQEFAGHSFHDAGEALDWANLMIRTAVKAVSL